MSTVCALHPTRSPSEMPGLASVRVWLLWDCTDLVGCSTTEAEAVEARADLRQQLRHEYGPDQHLLDSVTITPVLLDPATPITPGRPR